MVQSPPLVPACVAVGGCRSDVETGLLARHVGCCPSARGGTNGGAVADVGYERISVERDAALDGLVTVTLDRPVKLNALDFKLHAELQALCTDLETDLSTRVVIHTGARRAFSAGAALGSRPAAQTTKHLDRPARLHHGGGTWG